MNINIEIKAIIRDFQKIKISVEKLTNANPIQVFQEDIFFNSPFGRLKLRIMASDKGQLIYYNRDDSLGPKKSDYLLYENTNPKALKEVLSASYGIRGVVRKNRFLYFLGNTRLHLDQVESLGDFIELEVVLEKSKNEEEGIEKAKQIMAKLEINEKDLITKAYIDIQEEKKNLKLLN
jgi:predicted adenylyl cyclase CyaB